MLGLHQRQRVKNPDNSTSVVAPPPKSNQFSGVGSRHQTQKKPNNSWETEDIVLAVIIVIVVVLLIVAFSMVIYTVTTKSDKKRDSVEYRNNRHKKDKNKETYVDDSSKIESTPERVVDPETTTRKKKESKRERRKKRKEKRRKDRLERERKEREEMERQALKEEEIVSTIDALYDEVEDMSVPDIVKVTVHEELEKLEKTIDNLDDEVISEMEDDKIYKNEGIHKLHENKIENLEKEEMKELEIIEKAVESQNSDGGDPSLKDFLQMIADLKTELNDLHQENKKLRKDSAETLPIEVEDSKPAETEPPKPKEEEKKPSSGDDDVMERLKKLQEEMSGLMDQLNK